jgi:hypothetical protein
MESGWQAFHGEFTRGSSNATPNLKLEFEVHSAVKSTQTIRGKMTITESNVLKVTSVMTGIYWVVVSLLFWIDYRSGNWMEKGGWWIAIILFTGTCGLALWAMLAPSVIRSFRAGSSIRGIHELGWRVWHFSTIPMVLLSFGFLCLLVFYRITEG